jgi:hypothetical protein
MITAIAVSLLTVVPVLASDQSDIVTILNQWNDTDDAKAVAACARTSATGSRSSLSRIDRRRGSCANPTAYAAARRSSGEPSVDAVLIGSRLGRSALASTAARRTSPLGSLIQSGVNAKVAQTLAGHHSASFTLDQYADAVPEQLEEAGEKVANVLLQASGSKTVAATKLAEVKPSQDD